MSTPSTVAMLIGDKVHYIYCHNDGYVEKPGIGHVLHTHYKDTTKVHALIALGNMSQIAPSIECPEGHSFDTYVRGYSVAYSRDRGDRNQSANVVTKEQYMNNDYDSQNYNYLFTDGEWYVRMGRTPAILLSHIFPVEIPDADEKRVEEELAELAQAEEAERKIVLSDADITKAVTKFIIDSDADALAHIAEICFGGVCIHGNNEYTFYPNENYADAFAHIEK